MMQCMSWEDQMMERKMQEQKEADIQTRLLAMESLEGEIKKRSLQKVQLWPGASPVVKQFFFEWLPDNGYLEIVDGKMKWKSKGIELRAMLKALGGEEAEQRDKIIIEYFIKCSGTQRQTELAPSFVGHVEKWIDKFPEWLGNLSELGLQK